MNLAAGGNDVRTPIGWRAKECMPVEAAGRSKGQLLARICQSWWRVSVPVEGRSLVALLLAVVRPAGALAAATSNDDLVGCTTERARRR